MLIGLAAKNAILIVEFAKAKHEKDGMGIEEAALESARLRFRPILMTAFAFILGVIPLMKASGAGAGAQNVMGTAVFWGMLVATALGVFLIPGNYAFVELLGRKKQERPRGDTPTGDAAQGGTEMRRLLLATLRPWPPPARSPNYKGPGPHAAHLARDPGRRVQSWPTRRGGSSSDDPQPREPCASRSSRTRT
jgi:hypothetical protein